MGVIIKKVVISLLCIFTAGLMLVNISILVDEYRSREGFGYAEEMCKKMETGLLISDAVVLAKKDTHKGSLEVNSYQMRRYFDGGCRCTIPFKDGKTQTGTALCLR